MKTDCLIAIIICLSATFFINNDLSAQEVIVPSGYELADSVVYRQVSVADTLLMGKDVFNMLPSSAKGDKADVNVHQSKLVEESMRNHIMANKERTFPGYRVRIFFDNRQTARTASEETLNNFTALYPDVPAYRTYANPYFKVTVGDFRTKSEAMELLARIRRAFPSAFIIKENINYPVIDKNNAVVADTVKVLRPRKAVQ